MRYHLKIQDSIAGPDTLLTLVREAATDASGGDGMFAFASVKGIDKFFSELPMVELLQHGRFHLIIGISAVTNRAALERVAQLQSAYPGRLTAQVFWDREGETLFHPKLCRFSYPNGGKRWIVGSGNLTPGGLSENYEASSVLVADPGEDPDDAELRAFLHSHRAHLFDVTDPAVLERASRNIVRSGGGRRRRVEEADVVEVEPEAPEQDGGPEDTEDPEHVALIVVAPKSRGGFSQLQLSGAALEEFFEIPVRNGEPLTLRHRDLDGVLHAAENRSVVYSDINKNVKVEIGAAHNIPYPPEGRPILVFRRLAARAFEYVMLLPGDPGHDELIELAEAADDSLGGGFPKVVRSIEAIRGVWPDCPFPPEVE